MHTIERAQSARQTSRPADPVDLVDAGCAEAGAALLGTALYGDPHARDAVAALDPTALTDTRQRAVHEAMRTLIADGAPLDPVVVLGQLRAGAGEVRMPAGRDAGVYLTDLVGAAQPGSARWYLRVVLDYAMRRTAREAGQRIADAAGTAPLDTLADLTASECARVAEAADRRATA